MTRDNKFADDYSLENTEVVSSRGLKLAEPPRFAKKYGSDNAYEGLSLDIWELLIQPGDVVCDVGAHHGIYSLVAAQTKKPKSIYAYEPSKDNIALLENNIKLNGFGSSITPRRVALSDSVGEAKFQITEASDNANLRGHPNSPTLRTEVVKTSTLDEDFKNSKLDLIKIDTDGFEPFILDGAKKTFKNNPGLKMLIEFNPKCLRRSKCDPLKFLNRLVGLEFELYLIDDLQNAISRITERKDIWNQIQSTPYFYNILCTSKASPELQSFIDEHTEKRIKALEERVIALEQSVQEARVSKAAAEARLDKIHSTKTWRYVIKPLRKTLRPK